jgi:hypothetical protein
MPEARDATETANPPWLVTLGALLSPLGALLQWLLPLPLEPAAHRLAAIVRAVLVAWLTEVLPLPVTPVLIAPALVALRPAGLELANACTCKGVHAMVCRTAWIRWNVRRTEHSSYV